MQAVAGQILDRVKSFVSLDCEPEKEDSLYQRIANVYIKYIVRNLDIGGYLLLNDHGRLLNDYITIVHTGVYPDGLLEEICEDTESIIMINRNTLAIAGMLKAGTLMFETYTCFGDPLPDHLRKLGCRSLLSSSGITYDYASLYTIRSLLHQQLRQRLCNADVHE